MAVSEPATAKQNKDKISPLISFNIIEEDTRIRCEERKKISIHINNKIIFLLAFKRPINPIIK